MIVRFINSDVAEKFNLTTDDVGEIIAEETRDGTEYVSVLFETVELSGVKKTLFFEEAVEEIEQVVNEAVQTDDVEQKKTLWAYIKSFFAK